MRELRRIAWGTGAAFAGIGICIGILLPFRSDLSTATTALVLIVPVVLGTVVGGFGAGVLAALAGFLAYDVLFIKPYGTLDVGAAQNWVALIVYLAVVLLISSLVASLDVGRTRAALREQETRRLYRLVERLVAERPLDALLQEVLGTAMETFRPRWAAVVLPDNGRLEVVATAGAPLEDEERRALTSGPGRRRTLALTTIGSRGVRSVALHVQGRPVGLLALADAELSPADRELLGIYAAQVAQAIERSELRETALKAEMLEASERWRRALLGAVSHDLRSPLATIKAAVTAVRESEEALTPTERRELLALAEGKSDELARLVTNLLDVTRIQAGTLQLQRAPTPVEDVVAAAMALTGGSLDDVVVRTDLDPSLPPVDVDELLMVQVVANLLENAARHSPPGGTVEMQATSAGPLVRLAVCDHGAGVPASERDRIFEMWTSTDGGGRAGLGLGIAKAFVEAHGTAITLEETPGGGATFAVTMGAAPVPASAGRPG